MLAGEYRVCCDLLIAVEHGHRLTASLHLDPLPDEADGHGVAVRRQTDQIIFGDNPRDPGLLLEAALRPRGTRWSRSRANRTSGSSWVVP